jgi:hypothetical protein
MKTARLIPAFALFVMLVLHVSCCNECRQPPAEELPYEAATFEVEGDVAFMYGVIDHTTPAVVQALFDEHSGVTRIVEPCGKLGVHSWDEDGPDGGIILGNEVPKGHELHAMFLEFYREMEIPEDFYWFTLEAAPPQRIHWMSDEEVLLYGLVTEASP